MEDIHVSDWRTGWRQAPSMSKLRTVPSWSCQHSIGSSWVSFHTSPPEGGSVLGVSKSIYLQCWTCRKSDVEDLGMGTAIAVVILCSS